jgi:hypothetical protein
VVGGLRRSGTRNGECGTVITTRQPSVSGVSSRGRGRYLGHPTAANEAVAAACDSLSARHTETAEIQEGAKVGGSLSRQTLDVLELFAAKSEEHEAVGG